MAAVASQCRQLTDAAMSAQLETSNEVCTLWGLERKPNNLEVAAGTVEAEGVRGVAADPPWVILAAARNSPCNKQHILLDRLVHQWIRVRSGSYK